MNPAGLFDDVLPEDFRQSVTGEITERQLAVAKEAVAGRLADRRWRLRNLYCIKPEGGGEPIPYTPKPEQEEIYDHFEKTPDKPCFIIKSRRIGFSTAISILGVDDVTWNPGRNAVLIDLTAEDAKKKMREQIRYAFDSIPPALLDSFERPVRATTHMAVKAVGQSDSKASNFFAGMNARGGDASFLWVSEWGKFANDPKDRLRSEEVKTGAWPSARKGFRVVETTWKGGRNGDLWEMIQPIMDDDANADGVLHFFPWHCDPVCVSIGGEITADVVEYFRVLSEKLDKKFSPEQKKWWAVNKKALGIHMPQEFPSTIDEALSSPGDAPLFSQSGMDWAEKHGAHLTPMWGSLSGNRAQRTAGFNILTKSEPAAWLRVWERPQIGKHYILPVDLCTGEMTKTTDPDFHAAPVIRAPYMDEARRIHPGLVCAAIRAEQRTPLQVFARQIAELSWYYGNCITIIEINKHSGFIQLCQIWGLSNIFQRVVYPDAKDQKKERREPGWLTTAANKPVIIDSLNTFLREESLIIPCARMISELRAFQIDLEALQGNKDDWVMALAMGIHHLHLATCYGAGTMDGIVMPQGPAVVTPLAGTESPEVLMEQMPWSGVPGMPPDGNFGDDSILC